MLCGSLVTAGCIAQGRCATDSMHFTVAFVGLYSVGIYVTLLHTEICCYEGNYTKFRNFIFPSIWFSIFIVLEQTGDVMPGFTFM